MEKKLTFIDAEGVKFTVDINVTEKDLSNKLDYETLKQCSSKSKILSITGECGFSCGQVYDSINPCTVAQQKLVDFWKKYHLNDSIPGTKRQMDYLKGGLYDEDYEKVFTCVQKILDTHGIAKEQLSQFNEYGNLGGDEFITLENRLIKLFGGSIYHERYFLNELGNAHSGLHKVGIHTYLMLDVLTTPSMKNDYSVMRAFLAGRGLLTDRGYTYGTSWLYKPFDEEELMKIIDMVEQEEAERKANNLADLKESYKNNKKTEGENKSEEEEELPDVNEDSQELLDLVMSGCNCDRWDAIRVIALLRSEHIDLDELWNIDVDSSSVISCGKTEYYVDTYSNLKQIAIDYLTDDRDLWIEAVKSGSTDDSLKDWVEKVVNYDGIGNVLNHWDGKEDYEWVFDEQVYIVRR